MWLRLSKCGTAVSQTAQGRYRRRSTDSLSRWMGFVAVFCDHAPIPLIYFPQLNPPSVRPCVFSLCLSACLSCPIHFSVSLRSAPARTTPERPGDFHQSLCDFLANVVEKRERRRGNRAVRFYCFFGDTAGIHSVPRLCRMRHGMFFYVFTFFLRQVHAAS